MNNLKCRAWDSVKEEYIYSDNIAGGMWRFFKTLEDRGIRHFESEFALGLQDINSIDIYEGDLIQVWGRNNDRPCQVIFTDGKFQGKYTDSDFMFTLDKSEIETARIKVVGNIYERLTMTDRLNKIIS